ncbi:MAG: phage tail protein [Steroidobacteraceae bacterium]
MANPFLGEIRMFAGNFAPQNWAFCDGQLLSISQYTALFSLLGTQYGGNGTTDFALPDLRSRVPIHQGTLVGGNSYIIGESGGEETVTLATSQLPAHSHQFVSTAAPVLGTPAGAVLGSPASGIALYAAGAPTGTLNPSANVAVGGNQAHPNLMPYLCVTFIIALAGIFPSRN